METVKICPSCNITMGYDFEGSVEWHKCSICGYKEYLPKKIAGDFTIGECIAINIYTNQIVCKGTEKECLLYCSDTVKLYGSLIRIPNK